MFSFENNETNYYDVTDRLLPIFMVFVSDHVSSRLIVLVSSVIFICKKYASHAVFHLKEKKYFSIAFNLLLTS